MSLEGLKKKNSQINIIDFLIIAYISSSYIFSLISKYVLIFRIITIIFVAFLLIYLIRERKFKIVVDSFVKYSLAFLLFGFISILWAKNQMYTLSRVITILESLVVIILLYNYIYHENKKEHLILSMVISGSLYSVYILSFYGIGNYIRLLQNSERIGSELANVNTIGVILAFTCVICLWLIIYQHKFFMILPLILNSVISVGTGSKKVILCLVVGIFLLVILKAKTRKEVFFAIIETAIVGILLYFVSQLSLFATINGRFDRFFSMITGAGKVDGSSIARLYYIKIGLIEFLKRPFWGVGLGNSRWITYQYVGKETYLHCNYVELLASVGIVGFVLYYAMYFIPFKRFIKYGIRGNSYHILGVVMVLLRLITHIAAVTYYDKIEYMSILFVMCLISPKSELSKNMDLSSANS